MKIFSIDAAIARNRPQVELRGRLYPVRDMTLEERLRRMVDLYREQAALEADADPDEGAVRDLRVRAVHEALEGVPDEVAADLTELEFTLLTRAIKEAREMVIPLEVRDATEAERDAGKAPPPGSG